METGAPQGGPASSAVTARHCCVTAVHVHYAFLNDDALQPVGRLVPGDPNMRAGPGIRCSTLCLAQRLMSLCTTFTMLVLADPPTPYQPA